MESRRDISVHSTVGSILSMEPPLAAERDVYKKTM